jgi:predicted DNA-binding transcriptional regulator AlpA
MPKTPIPDAELALARVLTDEQTRQLLGDISDSTWERMKRAGDIPPATKISERRIGRRLSDVIEWLDKRRRVEPFQKIGDAAQRVVESCCGADIRDHSIKMQRELNRRREGGDR